MGQLGRILFEMNPPDADAVSHLVGPPTAAVGVNV